MRLSRVLFVLALVMVPGCGGCDSCFGAAQPGDEAGTAATSTSTSRPATLAVEAGVDAAVDSGVTAATDAGNKLAPIPYLRDGGGLPRPKAPMPLGDFQSCGTYEGPLCEKACKGGACRQECDGVDCVLTCKGGYCSQLCGPTGTTKCTLSCEGGHCTQLCMRPEGCTKDCAGGACD